MKFKLILFLVGVTVLASYVFWTKKPEVNKNIITGVEQPDVAKETPFYDLTIDYLRSRKYDSVMGNMTLYKSYDSYNSYTTSYTSDGLKINALLTMPKDSISDEKYPAIVFVHGYIAPTIYRTTERYTDYVDYLARNGYVVLKIDLRGHGGSEGEAGGAYYSSDYIIDTLNAYNALSKADFVDSGKIGLWGHSMAGNIVSRSVAVMPDIPAAAIWAGAGFTYSDLLEYRISDMSYRPPQQSTSRAKRREELRNAHGDFNPDNEFWMKVPSTNYLKDFKSAIGLFHSVDDTVVSIEYSRNFKKLLDASGVKNEYHEYKSGGHNISNPSFSQAMDTTVKFFDKYLKD